MVKTIYRQYQQCAKVQTMLKNNLISLLDTAFPDANRLFASPARADGSEKWVDFVAAFWHCECVCELSEKTFTAKYQKWCKKHSYNLRQDTALDICASACGHFSVMPKTDTAKLLVEQAVSQLRAVSAALAALRNEMQSLAASLPEYPMEIHSRRSSKRRSSALRRTLFLVMSAILQRSSADNPVYQFMDKKRAEGKPYRVYMMASANKFLRICYATVKQYLDSLEA